MYIILHPMQCKIHPPHHPRLDVGGGVGPGEAAAEAGDAIDGEGAGELLEEEVAEVELEGGQGLCLLYHWGGRGGRGGFFLGVCVCVNILCMYICVCVYKYVGGGGCGGFGGWVFVSLEGVAEVELEGGEGLRLWEAGCVRVCVCFFLCMCVCVCVSHVHICVGGYDVFVLYVYLKNAYPGMMCIHPQMYMHIYIYIHHGKKKHVMACYLVRGALRGVADVVGVVHQRGQGRVQVPKLRHVWDRDA